MRKQVTVQGSEPDLKVKVFGVGLNVSEGKKCFF